ncbi:MAG TPA: M48 family metallopeptidase [Rhizomicrobium sp.]
MQSDGVLEISDASGAMLAAASLKQVRTTSRLGATRRRLDFPDGGSFDTSDNDAVDAFFRHSGWLHRLEDSWRAVLASVALAAAAAALFALYGVPATAAWLARHTPASVAHFATDQTLDALDRTAMDPTRLAPAVQNRYRVLFAAVAHAAPGTGYRLLFRNAPSIGANAFALPDGTVIMIDQMDRMIPKDEEIQGVFAHEMSHVTRAHGLQSIYQASLVPAAIAFITGDASQIGHIATILPGVLLQSAYSRGFEQQADDDAAIVMRRMGKNPGALGDLLERMEQKYCGHDGGCGPSWLGSHPATAARAARLRHAKS